VKMKFAFVVLGLAASSLALAQQGGGIGGIKLDSAKAKVGQALSVTVNHDGEAPAFCGMALDFGDGEVRDLKVETHNGGLPRTESKTYAKPGSYTVKAYGKKVTSHLPCLGKAEAGLSVEAVAPTAQVAPAAQAAPAKAAGPVCPEGYKMQGKAGKAGDFNCKAGKGAKTPEKMLECPDKLEYFQSKTALGCRKAGK